MLTFKSRYFLLTVFLFTIEICIALFVHDHIIRPYIGDLLVVILIYCFVRTFINISVKRVAIAVLLFSYTVEMLQYFRIVEILGLQQYKWARIIIGTSFAWTDILAYTIGIVAVLVTEKLLKNKSTS